MSGFHFCNNITSMENQTVNTTTYSSPCDSDKYIRLLSVSKLNWIHLLVNTIKASRNVQCSIQTNMNNVIDILQKKAYMSFLLLNFSYKIP